MKAQRNVRAALAQSVERLTRNEKVASSILAGGSIKPQLEQCSSWGIFLSSLVKSSQIIRAIPSVDRAQAENTEEVNREQKLEWFLVDKGQEEIIERLLEKSKEAFALAVELYNRPTFL